MGKETDKTGYDFHSGCLRNQSMYAVIARSIVYSGRYPTSSLIRVLSMTNYWGLAYQSINLINLANQPGLAFTSIEQDSIW